MNAAITGTGAGLLSLLVGGRLNGGVGAIGHETLRQQSQNRNINFNMSRANS